MAEVTPDGTATAPERPAWIAQLPDDLKGNETFTSFKTLGDFGKAHLEALGKVKELDGITAKTKDLEGKLSNSIPKLTDKSTPEEISAYRKAMNVPEKPEEYEFPKTEGTENSPEMIAWAQKTFHELGLPKDIAQKLGGKWNAFVAGMVEAEEKLEKEEFESNQKKFREQFKTEEEYQAGYKLAQRIWEKITGTKFDDAYKDPEAWKQPLVMNFIFNTAKAIGEDFSPKGGGGGSPGKPGLIYDKTPKD